MERNTQYKRGDAGNRACSPRFVFSGGSCSDLGKPYGCQTAGAYVPINNLVKSILEESVRDMKSNPEGLIFYNQRRGSIINTNQVNSYFNRVAEKAGIDITGQHSLRHTFATRCIEAGITPVVLKTWLGHTDIHVTLDTYSDVFDRLNHKSISQFEGYMTNQYNEVFVP